MIKKKKQNYITSCDSLLKIGCLLYLKNSVAKVCKLVINQLWNLISGFINGS